MTEFDVLVIGGGPAGLAAAISARREGASVALIEREAHLGGILKQCIHDGFGLVRFSEKLSGPEYAGRFLDEFKKLDIPAHLLTFVTGIEKTERGFDVTVTGAEGMRHLHGKTLVLATGCRERTAKQVGIHGERPSGVFTAGTAQHLVNLMGQLPTKRCVILGSGDIGLIMARRLTLEGARVEGVYEIKPTPSGLMRNIQQCLRDFDIPLHLSHTVTRVFGRERLTGVMVTEVDEAFRPLPGTERYVECDALILSVGLIPENELAESLSVPLSSRTGGPVCDQNCMTEAPGIFCCGNALHVNDLVDYVSESGETAGRAAAHFSPAERKLARLTAGDGLLYLAPQRFDTAFSGPAVLYFRSRSVRQNCRLTLRINGEKVWEKAYRFLRPPEMERLELELAPLGVLADSEAVFDIEEGL